MSNDYTGMEIAIIGLTGRYPKSKNIEEFWQHLRAGEELISFFSDDELLAQGIDPALLQNPDFVKAAGVLEDMDLFDAAFFGITPREAEIMDPQQRVFLECAWEALEHAGYTTTHYDGVIGVYAGAVENSYLLFNLMPNPSVTSMGMLPIMFANGREYMPTRVSYKLNLRGPSCLVQTACSTSLVAIHTACQSLINSECDIALAGGVSILVHQQSGYTYLEGGIVSPDGHCRAFDADAQGTIFSSGIGVVVLKPLEAALADRDTIHAVIRGSAVNNDGAVKMNFTAPSVDGQAEVIIEALATAGVDPETISYVETHGTATAIGDMIEIQALTQAFRASTDKQGFCAIGSVKTNVGHLDAAAGVTNIIKTVLALKHQEIPPSLHFKRPNPKIDFANSPFYVNTHLTPWSAGSTPRRAGVSSFGIGGTNAHLILEEAPPPEPVAPSRPWQLLLISAKTASALEAATGNLAAHLRQHPELNLADTAYTLQVGRAPFSHRRMVVCDSRDAAIAALEQATPSQVLTNVEEQFDRPVIFMFPGQDAQHIGMARDLYLHEPIFREIVDDCASRLRRHLAYDLRQILHPAAGNPTLLTLDHAALEPALFTIGYALARLWIAWGIRPQAMIGQGLGEYVAACIAEVLSLDDALALVAARARLMQTIQSGTTDTALEQFQQHVRQVRLRAPQIPYISSLTGQYITAAETADPTYWVRQLREAARFSGGIQTLLQDFEGVLLEVGPGHNLSLLAQDYLTGSAQVPVVALLPHAQEQGSAEQSILHALGQLWINGVKIDWTGFYAHESRGRVPVCGYPFERTRYWIDPPRHSLFPALPSNGAGDAAVAHRPVDPVVTGLSDQPERGAPTDLSGLPHILTTETLGEGQPIGRQSSHRPMSIHLRPKLPSPYVAPQTPVEQTIVQIWQQLLGIDQIGIHDSFFELGGNSLLITQVVARLREALRIDLSLQTVFDHPTIAELAQQIARHERDQPEILPITPVRRSGALPLSFAQQRLWFLDQLVPNSPLYNLPRAVRISGAVDVGILRRSFEAIVARHETLRTTFVASGGIPMQHIAPPARFLLPLIDLQHLDAATRTATIRILCAEEAQQPFDLASGPLMRACLLRLAGEEHILLVTMHHIVSDGWSMSIFTREMIALYDAENRSRGRGSDGVAASLVPDPHPSLPELPIQYADYAIWQRQRLNGPILEQRLAYWGERLAHLPVLDLPTDYPRPTDPIARGGTLQVALPHALSTRLTQISQQLDVTLFMTLLATFQALLYRYSGQDDIVVGTPIANRDHFQTEPLIGFFVNQLVIRTDFASAPTFRMLLQQVRETCLGAYTNQELPFEMLVEHLQIDREINRNPLFQVAFILQNAPAVDLHMADATLSLLELESPITQLDLKLSLSETPEGLQGSCEYNADIFAATTIRRMLDHLSILFDAFVADPDTQISAVSLVTDAERDILTRWNATGRDYPRSSAVHKLIAALAAEQPDTVALLCDIHSGSGAVEAPGAAAGDLQHVTYAALYTRAEQLARHLRTLGVALEQRVGVCLAPSADMVVGLLGILKAGGVYVPLDPDIPLERLAFMLNDAQIGVLLTTEPIALSHPLAQHASVPLQVVYLDRDWSLLVDQEAKNQVAALNPHPAGATPRTSRNGSGAGGEDLAQPATHNTQHLGDVPLDNLAYIIYTSGSTGTPKGVAVTHRNLMHSTNARFAHYRDPVESCLLISSLAFDGSVGGLFWTLCQGGCYIVLGEAERRDVPRILALIQARQVTHFSSHPAFYALLLEQRGAARLDSLKAVVVAGDACPRSLSAAHHQELPQILLFNEYGPTEGTVWSSVYECPPHEPYASVAIGRPIANVQIHLLDQYYRPVPIGVMGELYIAGAGLARGYHNRPDLTAERFVPNPFAQGPGARGQGSGPDPRSPIPDPRLYRTGDLARWREDGTIEFLGRKDHQVKIRGYRIELGEVETALLRHPQVEDAAVIVYEDAPGEKRLVAYVATGDWRLEMGDSEAHNLQSPISNLQSELRASLRDHLPTYMLPSSIVVLERIPRLANGKVDRKRLPMPEKTARQVAQSFVAPQTSVETILAEIWSQVLRLEQVGCDDNFFDLGGHSLLMTQIQSQIRNRLQYELPIVDLFRFPSIRTLAAFISERQQSEASPQPKRAMTLARAPQRLTNLEDTAIAIIGLAGRFPGANKIESFWRNLHDGVESVTFFSDQELLDAGVDPALVHAPNYVRAAAVLDNIELFDAAFFGYSPREAEIMDPQQRLFLECAWEALERAGYVHEQDSGPIGVFAGASLNNYMFELYADPGINESVGRFQMVLSNGRDHLATRVSYKLNLTGPSLTVQTACSTSLVAVHLARQSLLDGDCDLALAGGVSLRVPQKEGVPYIEGGTMSPDGHCRAFDAQARGTVSGSGLGVVVLKRLADALTDGDHIHAVIKGSAINNDGAHKVGYTAPGIDGQAAVITKALAMANIEPETIGYIEAHGTGTPLGDPIEIAALTQAFRTWTDKTGFCAIGSVKSNIGHLDAAAGIAGLVKTTLALEQHELPPTLHFTQPNPQIDFASSPFYVNDTYRVWPNGATPRRAGVSSFGMGGTNAHVVLEEAPVREPSGPSRDWQLLVISAGTDTALERATTDLIEHLRSSPDLNLADVAYTLQVGRRVFGHRRMLVCSSVQDAVSALETRNPKRVLSLAQNPAAQSVAFMFSGQGAQYVDMAHKIYQTEPVFREHFDRCAELLKPHLELDLRDVLYPADTRMEDGGWRMEDRDPAILHPPSSILNQTQYAQPALFAIEYALAQLWMAWGVRPRALIGHSIGEYVAACLADVFSLEDALMLVATRGRLMQRMPVGAMLAVSLPEDQLRPLLGQHLSLAAVNGPAQCVVAGPPRALIELEQRLAAQGTDYRRLHTSHAFHSQMMEPVLEPFINKVRTIQLRAPRLPYVSNLTGTWITSEQATNPDYWARHLREAVRFADGVAELLKEPNLILLEVGPGQTLSTLARQHPARIPGQSVLTTLRHPQDQQSDTAFLLGSLGQLWLAGVAIDWAGFYSAERRRRLPLPTYPFERQRYWVELQKGSPARPVARVREGKHADIGEWFYRPIWKPTFAPSHTEPAALLRAKGPWLIFTDATGPGMPLIDHLLAANCQVVHVQSGDGFIQHSSTHYTIRPDHKEDYQRLLGLQEVAPKTIVHLWSCTPPREAILTEAAFGYAQERGFYSLLYLIKAVSSQPDIPNLEVVVVSQHAYPITRGETLVPEHMPLAGACTVVNQEHPQILCRHIDLDCPAAGSWQEQQLIHQLLVECAAPAGERSIAYRHGERWSRTFEQLRLEPPGDQFRLRQHGVYLIIGGLGNIGLELAEHLAHTVQARLILTAHRTFPPSSEWAAWLEHHEPSDPTSQKIRRLQTYQAFGAEVRILQADVADEAQMRDVLRQIQEGFGQLHGIIYAAGASDEAAFAPIQAIERDGCELHFKPKVYGLLTLDRVFGDQELDFCLLFSSLASILGGLGFVAYAAANSFIDAFVHQHNQRSPRRWTSVNWDTWDVGESRRSTLGTTVFDFAMAKEEALQAVERVLAIAPQATQLINSTSNLEARINQWVRMETQRVQASMPTNWHARPDLTTAYVAPTGDAEQRIVEIWQELLGIDPIGIYDNFFDLGGHSLLGTQLVSRLYATFEVQVPLHMLFRAPTAAELALVIEALVIEELESAADYED